MVPRQILQPPQRAKGRAPRIGVCVPAGLRTIGCNTTRPTVPDDAGKAAPSFSSSTQARRLGHDTGNIESQQPSKKVRTLTAPDERRSPNNRRENKLR